MSLFLFRVVANLVAEHAEFAYLPKKFLVLFAYPYPWATIQTLPTYGRPPHSYHKGLQAARKRKDDPCLSKIRKYELNLSQGIARADGAEDHRNMMQAIESLCALGISPQTPTNRMNPSSTTLPMNSGITLVELLDKYFLLKTVKPATVLAHRNTVKEFSNFFQKKCYIADIMESDITRYQEFLATKGNVPRTIDGKVGYIKTLLNFAIKKAICKPPKILLKIEFFSLNDKRCLRDI